MRQPLTSIALEVAVGVLYNELPSMLFIFVVELRSQMLQVTSEQLKAAEQGEAVKIEAEGKSFVLLSRASYEEDLDFSPWTQQEMDLMADETVRFVAGDGFDEPDES